MFVQKNILKMFIVIKNESLESNQAKVTRWVEIPW